MQSQKLVESELLEDCSAHFDGLSKIELTKARDLERRAVWISGVEGDVNPPTVLYTKKSVDLMRKIRLLQLYQGVS